MEDDLINWDLHRGDGHWEMGCMHHDNSSARVMWCYQDLMRWRASQKETRKAKREKNSLAFLRQSFSRQPRTSTFNGGDWDREKRDGHGGVFSLSLTLLPVMIHRLIFYAAHLSRLDNDRDKKIKDETMTTMIDDRRQKHEYNNINIM